MATIDELIAQHKDWVPGSLKFTRNSSQSGCFTPYFKDNGTMTSSRPQWNGLTDLGLFFACMASDEDWKIYHEPKPKVTRWLWANKNGGITSCMFSEGFDDYTIKLLWSAQEFES